MEGEYNAEVVMTPMGKKTVRWIKPEDLDERMSSSRNILAKDRFDQPVFLFENDFALRWFADKYPDVELEERCSKYLGDICYREMETDGSQFTVE